MRMNTSSIVYLPELMGLEHDGTDTHCDPNEEYLFYRAVAEGAVSVVQDNCSQGRFENPEGKGRLSRDPLTNMKYHFVVTAALICRFCSESGMPMEEAYRLNDTYICQLDRCANIADVVLLHDQMAMDYTNRMLQRKKQAVASKQVSAAIDYIHTHLLERITVETLSKSVGVSSTFLSRIFKQELGVSVSEYIRRRKIDAAKNLLSFSDHSLVDIAAMLSYSSQSHFIQQFRSQVGVTPKAYREMKYGHTLDVNRSVLT